MKNIYSMTEIYKKYNLTYAKGGSIENKINNLKAKGIIIKEVPSPYKKKKLFQIIDDSIFNKEWIPHPIKNIELTKDGEVRNKSTKKIYSPGLNSTGYSWIVIDSQGTQALLHRLIMETFNPIENSNLYVVDHINGIRTDNRIENLRWVFLEQNNHFRDENQTNIGIEIARLIQKYGYTELLNKLKEL